VSDWNAGIIEEFRTNGGKVEQFGDAPLVILNTIGARSGQVREIPLVALHADDEMFIFASAAGSTKHPDWYHNLLATPEIEIETGTETYRATLTPLDEPARGERLAQQGAIMAQFLDYVSSAAPRLIPVFRIEPV
jgi:deazaflavin-dependent oxidoreductase (nitroreductase family)